MSSSITTAVPSGLITTDWCIKESLDWYDKPAECANSTLGQVPSDFDTICCAGNIVNTARDLWAYRGTNNTVNLDDLVCCRVDGPQRGGLQPLPTDRLRCFDGDPTPLASFAATNTDNAAIWEKTYSSASLSVGSTTTLFSDFIPRQTPTCLWVYTKTGVAMRNVTVPAADITTLPAPSTDRFGWPITTGTFATGSGTPYTGSSSATDAATSATSSSGAASAVGFGAATAWLLIAGLGLLRVVKL